MQPEGALAVACDRVWLSGDRCPVVAGPCEALLLPPVLLLLPRPQGLRTCLPLVPVVAGLPGSPGVVSPYPVPGAEQLLR